MAFAKVEYCHHIFSMSMLMLNECVLTSNEICLKFSEKKSQCIIIGPHQHTYVANVVLDGTTLMWVNSIKYLGIDLMAGISFDVDLDHIRRKFFCVSKLNTETLLWSI